MEQSLCQEEASPHSDHNQAMPHDTIIATSVIEQSNEPFDEDKHVYTSQFIDPNIEPITDRLSNQFLTGLSLLAGIKLAQKKYILNLTPGSLFCMKS